MPGTLKVPAATGPGSASSSNAVNSGSSSSGQPGLPPSVHLGGGSRAGVARSATSASPPRRPRGGVFDTARLVGGAAGEGGARPGEQQGAFGPPASGGGGLF